jgi:hypothetical protein
MATSGRPVPIDRHAANDLRFIRDAMQRASGLHRGPQPRRRADGCDRDRCGSCPPHRTIETLTVLRLA